MRHFAFPKGKMAIHVFPTGASPATMRWTGLTDHNWMNPANWVNVIGQGSSVYEWPALWPPAPCVDVVISSGATNYPELTDTASCRNIMMQDRAMLKNPHVLAYDSARVEIKLKPSERDRFIMWSAPLMDMYTGDYHFKSGDRPRWGDVYMNYFQQARPGGGTAEAYTFTATFGELNDTLQLGKAFNLKVTSTSATRDRLLVFPQNSTSYTADNGQIYPTARSANASKFITHGQDPYRKSDTTFLLPVANPNAGFGLIQVVNPYLAHLSFSQFHAGNSRTVSNGYYLWNGDINASFTVINTNGNRYSITAPSTGASPDLIPPLQSFLVVKSTPGDEVQSLNMSPNWTTTTSPTSYTLRAAPVSESDANTLRIKASQGNKTSYVILVYDQNASPAKGPEDMPVLFYDEIPLTLYSLTSLSEPLAIHASSEFQPQVDLGLRVREAGETKLEFTGLSGFGHDVYLIDKEKNNLEIDLQQQPEYTFVVNKPLKGILELNKRFSLRMEYTGNGLTGNRPPVSSSGLTVTGQAGEIHVHTATGRIRDVQVYHMGGGLIYDSRTEAPFFRIPAERGAVYIVKARTTESETYEVRKVWVK
jgi:hypothetical protein